MGKKYRILLAVPKGVHNSHHQAGYGKNTGFFWLCPKSQQLMLPYMILR